MEHLPSKTSVAAAPGKAGQSLLSSASALLAAKGVFVVAGYGLYVGLSRLLEPAQFGIFLVANSTVAVLNAAFVTGSVQTVSKFVSEHPARAAPVLRTALKLHALLAVLAAGIYLVLAPAIARALNDETLTPYLRLSAVIPFSYALYAAMIGYANGQRQFSQQAGFDMAYSAAKLTLVLALPWLGFGAFGAVGGFAAASALILLGSWWVIGRPVMATANRGPQDAPSGWRMFHFEAAVMAHVGLSSLLMQADLLMVKAWTPAAQSSVDAALYGSAVKLAQIPYSLLVALNFLIFPFIARSISQSATPDETRGYIRQALRLGIALSAGPAVVLAVIGRQASSLVFGSAYESAGSLLPVLTAAYVAFSLFGMTSTVINGSGRPLVSLAIAATTVAAQVTFTAVFMPSLGVTGVALGSLTAYLLGLTAATLYLGWRFGNVIPWPTIARVGLASGLIVLMAPAVTSRVHVIVAAPILGIVFLVALALLREWKAEDLRAALQRQAS